MNYELQERLKYREEWLRNFLISEQHKEINLKVEKDMYKEIPALSLLIKIYFIPNTILQFITKLRAWYYYNKCTKEIKILKEVMKKNEK